MERQNLLTQKLGWTIILNIVITIVEYAGGILSGSLALLSDAGHNLTDVFSLILGYFGEKVSDKRPDKRHTFGFKRTEVFTALINASILFLVAIFILYEAFERIHSPRQISLGILFTVGLIGLFGNLVSILILNKDKNKSLNMKATYIHLFYDTLSSVLVLIGGIIMYFTSFFAIDIILSVAIASMILWSGFEIIKSSIHIFMQGVPEGLNFDEICDTLKTIDGVKTLHNLHVWSVNSKDVFLSCHLCINKKTNADILIRKINQILKNKFKIRNTALQIENKQCENIDG